MSPFFSSPAKVFACAFALRIALLLYGLYQDAHSPLKYTDIDYYVFTDAARLVYFGRSPYQRNTYRYTPLLAWLLLPTAWGGSWFLFGKILFVVSDLAAGWLIYLVLRSSAGMTTEQALKATSVWILNPMVAQISTRGSSEGLLGVMVMALLWAVLQRRIKLAGVLLGIAVHFKIYPFIYAASIMWWLDKERAGPLQSRNGQAKPRTRGQMLLSFFNRSRICLAVTSWATFVALNLAMFSMYGQPFVHNTYLHHVTRIDHRHNFSPYNILLYLNSSPARRMSLKLESIAFVPQLFLSAVAIPLALAKKELAITMLAQTFAFVTFNKVCTSQYFLWYMIFLPFYLPKSSLLERPRHGIAALILWISTQAFWLQQAYKLEFLGKSTFVPGMWSASMLFFGVNVWILGVIISDGSKGLLARSPPKAKKVA